MSGVRGVDPSVAGILANGGPSSDAPKLAPTVSDQRLKVSWRPSNIGAARQIVSLTQECFKEPGVRVV
jgi:hypothetical protein